MKAYKGFNKDMTCRGFQYEEGEEYETNEASLCSSGFHACEAPVDCFRYYAPSESVYHEVELDGVTDETSDDSKKCGTKIKIGARVDIAGIVKAQFDFVKAKTTPANSATGDWSANSATGSRSANSATGDWSANSATGYGSANSATGYGSANSATGYGSANVTTGEDSRNEGAEASVNVGWGRLNKCKGTIGSYLVLSEWGDWDGKKYPLKSATMVYVDGETIKEDVWYWLKDGKVEEAK